VGRKSVLPGGVLVFAVYLLSFDYSIGLTITRKSNSSNCEKLKEVLISSSQYYMYLQSEIRQAKTDIYLASLVKN